MITGIQDVYYNVSDMDRAIEFYDRALGLKTAERDPYFTALEVDGLRLGLHATGGRPVPRVDRDAHGAHAGATITFRVDDLDAARERLEQGGVEILGASDNPWGRILVFEDPDGNVLKLMEPPAGAS